MLSVCLSIFGFKSKTLILKVEGMRDDGRDEGRSSNDGHKAW